MAIPNSKRGSGLTVLIGPNGGGKSTLVECFQKISIRHGNVSFTSGKRNKQSGDKVSIEVIFDESSASLSTVEGGGSEAVWNTSNRPRVYFLPARRVFNPYFGRNIWDRSTYKAWIIPSDDVRDKPERNIKKKEGLVNENGELKAEYTDYMKQMFGEISGFLQDTNKLLI